ncbi:MAG: hypothetical protein PHN56_03660 [Candidatus Nanoarchaeia archaeon]|nr:hypothetical protein [Candidatus Nanoarchaeia archaeon]
MINAVNSNILNNQKFIGKSLACTLCGLFYYQYKKNKNENLSLTDISEYSGYTNVAIMKRYMDFCRIKLKNELNAKKELTAELIEETFMTSRKDTLFNNLEIMIIQYPEFEKKIKSVLKNYSAIKKSKNLNILDLGPKLN